MSAGIAAAGKAADEAAAFDASGDAFSIEPAFGDTRHSVTESHSTATGIDREMGAANGALDRDWLILADPAHDNRAISRADENESPQLASEEGSDAHAQLSRPVRLAPSIKWHEILLEASKRATWTPQDLVEIGFKLGHPTNLNAVKVQLNSFVRSATVERLFRGRYRVSPNLGFKGPEREGAL